MAEHAGLTATAALFAAGAFDPAPLPPDAVEVARVVGAWGIKGGIKVKPFAANPQALLSSKRWFIQPLEGHAPAGARPAVAVPALPPLLRVVTARTQGDAIVATLQEVPSRDAAEALKGARVFVSRASFPTPDDDEFYWVDLIGLDVVNQHGAGLGVVAGLIETGPHCVLRVQPPDAALAEVLIPFVSAYVGQVDMPARRISVDWQDDN